MPRPPIAALEIGTSRVRILVGECREDGSLVVTGVGEQPSRGVRKSEIVNMDFALSCLRSAMLQAEEQADVDLRSVYLLLTGSHIESLITLGSVPVLDPDHEIGEDEIQNAMEASRITTLNNERSVLHGINQCFTIDNGSRVVNPLGMIGTKLSLNALIIHGLQSCFVNMEKVVVTADLEVEEAAFGGLCSALAVLSPEAKEAGALVIDLGGGTTDYVVYAGQCMADAGAVGVGGDHITNDIRMGFKISNAQAEKLKISSGAAIVDYEKKNQRVSVPAEGTFSGMSVKLADLQTVINVRMEELLTIIKRRLEERHLLHEIGAGIYCTGGGAKMKGLAPLVEKVFNRPCHIGRPRNVSGIGITTESPEFASTIGLLKYAIQAEERKHPSRHMGSKILSALLGKTT